MARPHRARAGGDPDGRRPAVHGPRPVRAAVGDDAACAHPSQRRRASRAPGRTSRRASSRTRRPQGPRRSRPARVRCACSEDLLPPDAAARERPRGRRGGRPRPARPLGRGRARRLRHRPRPSRRRRHEPALAGPAVGPPLSVRGPRTNRGRRRRRGRPRLRVGAVVARLLPPRARGLPGDRVGPVPAGSRTPSPGATTPTRSRRGRRDGRGSPWWTRRCARSRRRAGCTTVPG